MDQLAPFTGFPREALRFFASLKRNNNRDWFTRHKQVYLDHVLRPAQSFVAAMATALGRIYPEIVADPGPGGSIFRIYRDTRFSGNKEPYKTHLGIFFWQSGGRKMDRPGFYFELNERGVRLYYGWYIFPPEVLKRYRQAVADARRGAELAKAVRAVQRCGITVGGQHYKRIPRGFDGVDASRANLIRHNTICTDQDLGRVPQIHSARLIAYCAARWKRCLPIHRWVQGIL